MLIDYVNHALPNFVTIFFFFTNMGKFYTLLLLVAFVNSCAVAIGHPSDTVRLKRGFGAANSFYDNNGHVDYNVSGGGGYGHAGGAAGLAQQAANQAKAALAAQNPAAHQASQQARAILAAQASQSAQQALAVVSSKQQQVNKISRAYANAQAAAFSEAAQTSKTQTAVHAAETAKFTAISHSRYYYGGRKQIYVAQMALREARNVAEWQARKSHEAQEKTVSLSHKLEAAYGDLSLAQAAANKASWAASAAQSNINVYG